ncbi:GntR family transcriptional regulator [Paenarthrobacter sp. NPDC090522]|uniref:GntR family transcriptional regulator n=1 Tax=Paenarthrobacter sp. NPDC090522 TaxID=3364383 RepID=UPI00381FF485
MGKLERISLKDRLAGELRRKILSGELRPHARIIEQELSDEYGVSRAVVRESMLILELQGLIVSTPYKGSEVASISRSEVEHLLLPIRVQIEQFALTEGFSLFDAETFEAFDRALAEMERAVLNKDSEAFNEADMRFHAVLVDTCPADSVRGIWDSIHQRTRMHFALQTGRTGATTQFLEDHKHLARVFRSGDLDASLKAIEEHIIGTNQPYLDLLDDAADTA